jgi:plasmid stabilization system protein ParE
LTVEQIGPRAARRYSDRLRRELDATARHKLSYEETTLQYGALRGATASTWYQESGPTLFVQGARRAVFITGALTRQELIAFAEGLKPVPADAGP